MIALCVMANNKMPLPLESGVQKDLSWPAMYAIEFTNFRPEIFPDLFARYVFWLSYYAPSQQLKYNLWLDFWNLTWTWRNKTYAQGAWGGSSSAEFAGVLVSDLFALTHLLVWDAWWKLGEEEFFQNPDLFCFCSGLFSGSECKEFSWCSKQMLFLHYFAKLICNWQILKKVIFENMKYQILA